MTIKLNFCRWQLLVFTAMFFLCPSHLSFGQDLLDSRPNFYDQGNGFFEISLEGGYDSDGIQSEFFRSFLKGGLISREIRTASAPDLQEINRLGISYSSDVSLSFPAVKIFKKDSLNLILTAGQEQNIAGEYDHAFYTLILEGNASFDGDLAKFENVRFENWLTRSAGIGVHNRKNGNQISLKLHQGISRQKYFFESGQTQTTNDGQFINTDITGNLFSNEFNEDSNTQNGIGLGIDGRIQLLNSLKAGSIFFSFRNLGFMCWPKEIQEIKLEDSFSFEGVDLSDIFSPDFSSVEVGSIDSYLSLEKTRADNLELLPIQLQLDYWKKINEKLYFNFGLNSKLIYDWRPEIVASLLYELNPTWHLGGGIKYGGFGKPNLNLNTAINIRKYWYASMNLSYLSGWVSNSGYGSHLRVGLTRVLNFKQTQL